MHLPPRFVLLIATCSPVLFAAPPTPSKPLTPSPEKSKFVFSLLPRSFQSHPSLDLVGLTEMTDDGKKLPVPSPENPIFYQAYNSGFHTEGDAGGDHPKADPSRLIASLQRSLEKAGYKLADEAHPPTQVIFMIWGSHNTISKTDDDALAPPANYWPNVLSRAKLVGGAKFAADFEKALSEQFNSPINMGIGNPLYRFTNRDDLTRELVEQVYDDCYYLVVSAYDSAALQKNERKLLWRTKLTTAANGVSLDETLPALISTSANYLGRDTPVPEISVKRIDRKGTVTLGADEVVEVIDDKRPESPPKNPQPNPQPTPAK